MANWRTAVDEINYRRFFDINELVALRMEEPAVFEATHGLLKRLVADGTVTGIRVDHPDGLLDPGAYFEQLQKLTGQPLYVVAEKILSPGESLNPDWPIAGTTGYGFSTWCPDCSLILDTCKPCVGSTHGLPEGRNRSRKSPTRAGARLC